MQIKILRKDLYPKGPQFATIGSCAIDLICTKCISLDPGETKLVGTGLAAWIGSETIDLAGLVLPRSGLGNKGLILGNTVGLIDADYQGEIKVSAYNRTTTDIIIVREGQRFAQMCFVPMVQPNFEVVEDFEEATERGAGGFGSTGKGEVWLNSWEDADTE
tara:strand:+ start:3675 stop:4157 length:483 start_codon:yes stop_codon:yes gene_type:complete